MGEGTIFRFCGGHRAPLVPPTRENPGNDTTISLLHDTFLKFFIEMFDYSDKTHCFSKIPLL